MARLDFRGAAATCAITAGCDDTETALTIDGDLSNWPTGASGRRFVATIDRGVAGKVEKVLCSAIAGQVLTVLTRGYDGTTAVTHDAGCSIEHTLSASVLDDYGGHVYDATRDDHTQYLDVDGVRPPSSLDAWAGTPGSIAAANAEGSADTVARSDHAHRIPNLGVATAHLADDAVTAAKIADGVVGAAHLADDIMFAGMFSGTTDAFGDLSVASGCPFTPSAYLLTLTQPLSGANTVIPQLHTGGTTFIVRFRPITGSAAALSVSGFYLLLA